MQDQQNEHINCLLSFCPNCSWVSALSLLPHNQTVKFSLILDSSILFVLWHLSFWLTTINPLFLLSYVIYHSGLQLRIYCFYCSVITFSLIEGSVRRYAMVHSHVILCWDISMICINYCFDIDEKLIMSLATMVAMYNSIMIIVPDLLW